ncbi:MAG: GNAT family N-acetyltransferase [Gallionellaceae bacterium]|nr:MAG: GNAT family N-acetyltransferase [Gallionellaceae bacterium]
MYIRVATPSDAPAIAALHAASWRIAYRGALSDEYLAGDIVSERNSVWAERFRSPPHTQHVAVAEVDNQLVGFACAYAGNDPRWGALLDNIHVTHALQRQGIGTQLMSSVASWCAKHHSHQGLFLWVLQSNAPAQHFYENLGAVNAGSDIWLPPGGGTVPRFRYAWQNVKLLLEKCG